MIQRAAIFLLTLLAVMPAAHADLDMRGKEPRYRDAAANAREQEVVTFLHGKGLEAKLPYQISTVDLNGDGVDEWIVRQEVSPACTANATCDFYVTGLSEGKIILLGRMEAGKVAISDDRTYGIHKLIVYNDKNNDYRGEPYLWSPKLFSYVSLTTFLR